MKKVHPHIPYREPGARNRQARNSRGYTSDRRKTVAFAVFAAAILAVAGLLILRSASRPEAVDSIARQMTISMSGFTPNALTARVGEPLKVNLINLDNGYHSDGGGKHNFVLEELDVNALVEPKGQAIITIRTERTGTYSWYCDICCGGKDNPSMRGTLTITP